MSHSTGTAAWIDLLAEKKQLFRQQGSAKAVDRIGSEDAFRTNFEGFCDTLREVHTTRLLVRLCASFDNILAFAEDVGRLLSDLSADALSALIWGISFALIVRGSRTRARIESMVRMVMELNRAVPALKVEDSIYTDDPGLQASLQEFFAAYVDSFFDQLIHFGQDDSRPAPELLPDATLHDIAQRYENHKIAYEKRMSDLVEQKKEEERQNAGRLVNGDPHLPHLPLRGNPSAYQIQIQLDFKRTLGEGAFSRVDEVQERSTRQLYACKKVLLNDGSSMGSIDREERAKTESNIMKRLIHRHIPTIIFTVRDSASFNILMSPVADCDLHHYLQHCGRSNFPTQLVNRMLRWFGCLLDALNHAHKLDIKHRDIKPQNILIKGKEPYLADFGLAKDFSQHDSSVSQGVFVEGTPLYFAPESRAGGNRGRPADLFSLGCVFSEMLTVGNHLTLDQYRDWRRRSGNMPDSVAYRDNLRGVGDWINRLTMDHINKMVVHQTLEMLDENPGRRPTAQEGVHVLSRDRSLFCTE